MTTGALRRAHVNGADFQARYRLGNGSAGNVGSDTLAHAVTNVQGVVAVRNPLPATGGVDPETPEDFTFGQTIYTSPFIAAAQDVEGGSSATMTVFRRMDDPSIDGVAPGYLTMGRLEIARCDNDPDRLDRGVFPAENCGVLGGSQVEFLRYYAQTAVDLVLRPENAAAWFRLHDKRCYNIVLEQFFLSACAGFHRFHPTSPYRGVQISHLFSSWEDAFDPNYAARVGFTHLVAGAKSHPTVGRRLEERVRREDPAYFRRCEKVLAAIS